MTRRPKVVVVGAGLAGLTAARCLERAGAAVTVLEARDRIGGRVLTKRDDFAEGQHGELGAELIEQEQTQVLALAGALGLETVRILRKGWGFHARSSRKADGDAVNTFEDAAERLAPEIEAFKAAGCRWDSAVAQQLAREPVSAWLRRVRAGAALSAGIRGLRGFYLADPADLALLTLVEQFAEGNMPGQSAMFRLRDGNDALPAAIARQLEGTIRLNSPVVRIARNGRRVTLTIGSRPQQQLAADYVVCTIPATLAKRILFDPALPDLQAKAIADLRYGPATKALLQFDRRFWRGVTRRSAYASDDSTGAVWDANEHQSRSPGILTLLAGGDASLELRELVERGGWTAVVRKLAWLGRPGALLTAAWASWEADPWARGGYAVFGPRFDPALRAWLARPAGRILFAGEHTSMKWQGFMNGAVESGRRAAVEAAMLAGLPHERITSEP